MAVKTMTLQSIPPTVNSLHASERARLLKSTRKLTDVLGTTPLVLDMDLVFARLSTTSVHKKRQGAIFYSKPSASSSFLSLPESGHRTHHPLSRQLSETSSSSSIPSASRSVRKPSREARPLIIRLHPISMYADASPLPSPYAASPYPVPTAPLPAPPLFSSDNESRIRRKRMAKLTRTLGENIPPELVSGFSQHHNSPPTHLKNGCSIAATQVTPPSPAFSRHKRKSRSLDSSVPSPSRPFNQSSSPLKRSASTVQSRRESEWDGEWNIKDAEKRAIALRNLRS